MSETESEKDRLQLVQREHFGFAAACMSNAVAVTVVVSSSKN
jgi:hypothetical protein